MRPDEAKPVILAVPAGDVHRLDAVAGRAFDEVIDRADRDYALSSRIERESDVREIRSGEELRLGIAPDAGALFDDADERLGGVRVAVDVPDCLFVQLGLCVNVRRRDHATHELDRGHREIDARNNRAQTQLLLDLRGMTVADRTERPHHTGPLRVVAVLTRLVA